MRAHIRHCEERDSSLSLRSGLRL